MESKKLEQVRNELYNKLPSGEIDSFELIKIIKSHIDELDKIIEAENRMLERQNKFNSGICPDCGEALNGKHVMGEGTTYSPCQQCKVELDSTTLKHVKEALGIKEK